MHAPDSVTARLSLVLDPLQDKIKDLHCRVVPSSFDSSDPYLRALPLAREWSWPTAKEHITFFKPQTLILQLPSFWQVEPFAHYASRAAEAPVCIIEPQNFPLDKAAIRFASADAILAEANEAAAVADYLVKEQIELPPYWLLVHTVDARRWSMPQPLASKRIQVAEEVHLAPGVPLLVQCEHIVKNKSNLFHHSPLFSWSDNVQSPQITTKEPMLFTLKDFALPFALKDTGVCACGKRLFARSI